MDQIKGRIGEYEKYFAIINASSDVNFGPDVELVQVGRVFSVINTPNTKFIQIEKHWEDNNISGIRPNSVSVNILQDGKYYQTVNITEDMGWEIEISLPSGYEYTLEEISVSEFYQSSVDGYIITNTLQSDIVLPKTGGFGTEVYYITGFFFCFMAVWRLYELKHKK